MLEKHKNILQTVHELIIHHCVDWQKRILNEIKVLKTIILDFVGKRSG